MSEALREVVRGLTRSQVVERLGSPRAKLQTRRRKLWIYYYDTIEIYFDERDIVEWTFIVDYMEIG